YAIEAGARAEGMFAIDEAGAQYERAIEALEKVTPLDAAELIDAILTWMRVAIRIREPQTLLPRLEQAEALARDTGDKHRLARALSWIGNVHSFSGRPAL